MIARLWHGRVPAAKAAAYRDLLNTRAIPDYRAVEGNAGVYILERTEGDVTHFATLTLWNDIDALKRFAGVDVGAAKYYPEDQSFLLELAPRVTHYEVVGRG